MAKNKSYIIKRIIDIDPMQKTEDLENLKIIDLLKMIEDLKTKSIIEIQNDSENYTSLAVYCGCSDI